MGPTGRSRSSGDSPVEVRCARRGLADLGFSLGYLCSVGTQADEANQELRFWLALRSSGGAKKKSHDGATPRDTSPRIATMSTLTDSSMPDPNEPTFDPGLDVAILVFSHVEHVKTRLNLARVSKLWLQASKPAAAYPSRFDFDAFPRMDERTQLTHLICLLDNDEALSLPYERVVGLLGEPAKTVVVTVCNYAAMRGSVRLLKWARENNRAWSAYTCQCAAKNGHLPALKYLHENGCPWSSETCFFAAHRKHWDCLQYAVDNKCPQWEYYAREYVKHLTDEMSSS